MSLNTGTRIGSYEISMRLGAGGMGEVYQAVDTKLKRQVAIKILPPAVSLDPGRLARFQREAEVLASLNHPNIAQIFGFEDAGGQAALVMELVEGETLAVRIARGPLPLQDAIPIATQIADALESAHERGIIHRDLKPANIKVRPDGLVKVLDFGLAKTTQRNAGSGEPPYGNSPSFAPTITTPAMTEAGVILGTASYMSPEQARGKPVDKRSDVWAFGCVLFEMLTGRRAFEGEDVTSTLAAILHLEPEWNALPEDVSPALSLHLRRSLLKDVRKRTPDIAVMRQALSGDYDSPTIAFQARPAQGWRWPAVTVAVALLAVLAWRSAPGPTPSAVDVFRLTVVPPTDAPLSQVGDMDAAPEISPDGRTLLFADRRGALYVRGLDSLNATPVAGGDTPSNKAFWSADSRSVFWPSIDRQLLKVRLPDGPAQRVATLDGWSRGGTENANGTILMSVRERLTVIRQNASKLLSVPGLTSGLILYPEFLPDGATFLFFYLRPNSSSGEIYLASLDGDSVGNPVLLLKNTTAARYTPAAGGRLLFVRDDNLYSQPLDISRQHLTDDPQLVVEKVGSGPELDVSLADFSVSAAGLIAWRPGVAALSQIIEFDRQGKAVAKTGPPVAAVDLRLSPDDSRLLALGDRAWLLEVGQSGLMDLGSDPLWTFWSSDGNSLIGFLNDRKTIVERRLFDPASARPIGTAPSFPVDLSPDGESILLSGDGSQVRTQRLRQPPGEEQLRELATDPDGATSGQSFSPDGRWVVYRAGGGLYVQPFSGPGLRRQIATFTGRDLGVGWNATARWRGDGREIMFFAEPDSLVSVRVEDLTAVPRFGKPQVLFKGLRFPAGANRGSVPLAISRDGSRIFWLQAAEQPNSNVIHIATNAVH